MDVVFPFEGMRLPWNPASVLLPWEIGGRVGIAVVVALVPAQQVIAQESANAAVVSGLGGTARPGSPQRRLRQCRSVCRPADSSAT
jgi:hypothetical protein